MLSSYSQKAAFSFEKSSSLQNHSSSGSLHCVKQSPSPPPPIKFLIPVAALPLGAGGDLPLTTIWKTLYIPQKVSEVTTPITNDYGKLKAYKSKQHFVEI